MADELEIKKKAEPELLKIPGVVGVGLRASSPKKIIVYVEKLTPEIVQKLPMQVDSIPVTIIETGKIYALQRTSRLRPAPGGVSIGHYSITAGTLGLVADAETGELLILSNNHVLAAKDSIQNSRASEGDDILQPGSYDGGTSEDRIGGLLRWIKIDETGENIIDAALAMPDYPEDVTKEILEIGTVTTYTNGVENMPVQKSGRTTALTTGEIIDVNATIQVGFDPFTATFTDQIITNSMLGAGDSGSLLCDMDGNAVGLSFAGGTGVSAHNKIENVIDALNINLTYLSPAGPKPTIVPLLLLGSLLLIPIIKFK